MLAVPRSWSELTPAWLTRALARDFPGAVVADVRVGPVADGTNRRAVVSVRYAAGAGPARLFVKREGRMINRLALRALGAWDVEARLAADDATAALGPPLGRPALHAGAYDRRRTAAIVIMEDVTLRGGRPQRAVRPLPVDRVADGLRGLAGLHARFWERPLPQPLQFLRPWRLGRTWAAVSLASLRWSLARLRRLDERALVPAGLDADVVDRGFRGWARLAAAGPQTLLHGDPHVANTYVLPDGCLGFYDWQLARTGSWAHDVGYFIGSSLTVADRRAHERDLLAGYLAELARLGVFAPDRADAWTLYRRTPVFGLGTWLHTLSGGQFQPVEECLATIERFAAACVDLGPL